MNTKKWLFIIIVVDLIFLLYGVSSLSISYNEAKIFYDSKSFLHYFVHIFTDIFGVNDLSLRAPFILLHTLSIILFYDISCFYLKKEGDRLLSVLTFVMLPGVVSSALLVNSASVVIFFTLLFIYLFLHKRENLYSLLLPLLIFIDNSFTILYLALFAYGLYAKNRYLTLFSAMLYLISLYIYGFGVHGKPRGFFLDTFGAYSLIFSPLIFLFFIYSLYRILIKGKKTILWFISFTALIYSILISFRQRIIIEDYAPFVVISIPLMLQIFLKSYRSRIKKLRGTHRVFFALVFLFLIVNFFATYLNKFFYRFLENPQRHFAYKYHIAKDLSKILRDRNISSINCNDLKMQKRLRFYGIKKGNRYSLKRRKIGEGDVTISYMNYPVISYSVTKLNR